MKKSTLVIILCLLLTGSLFSQNHEIKKEKTTSLIIINDEGTDISGEEVTVSGDISVSELVFEIIVSNTSAASISVKVKRTELNLISGTSNSFCWGISCYAPFTDVSPNPVDIYPGEMNESFSGHYKSNGNQGISDILYTFFDETNEDDSVSVLVHYEAIVASNISDISKNELLLYPNPSNGQFKVAGGNIKTIEVIDITGKIIYKSDVVNKTEYFVDLSSFSKGIYLVKVITGEGIKVENVIIR